MKEKDNKKILIIVATHGNEKIGVQIIKKLQSKNLNKYFNYLIANPKALQEKKEFINVNLNRVYPGKKKSHLYEERIAYKNIQIAKEYQYVIDIHEASKGKDDFIILPKEKLTTSFPIELINLKTLLLWPDPKGPLSQILNNAIELEFGSKNRNRNELINEAFKIVEDFIITINSKKIQNNRQKKEVYYVYGKLMKKNFRGKISNLKDFSETQINNETFYPLLVSQYDNLGIVCYKMKKIK